MEQFIQKHKTLALIVLIVAVGIFATIVFVNRVSIQTGDSSERTAEEAEQAVDDDISEAIRYITPLYTVTGNEENLDEVTIAAYPGYRNAAANIIYQLGLNPTDYKITFTYESPFKRYE